MKPRRRHKRAKFAYEFQRLKDDVRCPVAPAALEAIEQPAVDSMEAEARALRGRVAAPLQYGTLLTSAALALVIAAVGIYGALTCSVSRRTHEIGVRIALGAEPVHVLRQIVREGMVVGIAGIAAGLAIAFGASRVLANLLYGVEPRDPLTFGATGIALALIALAACTAPAWRASRVDPVVALRSE